MHQHQINMELKCLQRSLPSETTRFMRATTVGPTSSEYITAMPFSYAADRAVDRMVERGSYTRYLSSIHSGDLNNDHLNNGNI